MTFRFTLAAFLLTFLAVFLFTWRSYGASYDEPGLYRYAREARQAYAQAAGGIFDFNYTDPIQKHYGPFFLIAASFAADALIPLGWGEPDRWHFFYGLFFLLSLAAFYRLARRWFSGWSALALVALFASQPIIWGHAFMNPKDTPFLGFSILTLLLGLNLADRAAARQEKFPPAKNLPHAENFLPAATRAFFLRRAALVTLLACGPWTVLPFLPWLGQSLLQNPTSPLSMLLFRWMGFNPVLPLQNYLHKLTLWSFWLASAQTLLLALILLLIFPPSRARLAHATGEFLFWLTRPQTIFAAAALGLTLSLRLTAGLLALTLAAVFVWRLRLHALPLLLAFGLWSGAALLLAWPFLWLNPLKNLLKSLAVMTRFSQPGLWYAYPRLLLWQWSEPALALMVLGGLILARRARAYPRRAEFLLIFSGLSLAPIAALALSANLLYDNFRQFLFVWPGFFLLTGFAFEALFQRLKIPLRLALMMAAISVGGLAVSQLRPYEYNYYNSLVGGLSGAARQGLPTEYWGLSLREAAQFLNQNAPAQAKILTCGPVDSLRFDLRPDLSATFGCDEAAAGFDYAIVWLPAAKLPRPFASLPAEFTVQRQSVIFARVIRLP